MVRFFCYTILLTFLPSCGKKEVPQKYYPIYNSALLLKNETTNDADPALLLKTSNKVTKEESYFVTSYLDSVDNYQAPKPKNSKEKNRFLIKQIISENQDVLKRRRKTATPLLLEPYLAEYNRFVEEKEKIKAKSTIDNNKPDVDLDLTEVYQSQDKAKIFIEKNLN